MKRIFLVLLLSGCGRLSVAPPEATTPGVSEIDEFRAEYSKRLAAYDADTVANAGFPSRSDCDGALWAGEACVGGAAVAIEELEYQPGERHRRPAPACWSPELGDQGSQTTTSRDMATGDMACLWAKRDLGALQRLANYQEKHFGKIGEPFTDGRVLLGVNLTGLLGRMIYALSGGKDDRPYALAFESYLPVDGDSAQHIQALGILLQGEAVEAIKAQGLSADISAIALTEISPGMKTRLEELVQAQPTDFLFQAALGVYTGDFAEAVRLMMDPATPVPSYVRGDSPDLFARARWLMAAKIVLARFPQA